MPPDMNMAPPGKSENNKSYNKKNVNKDEKFSIEDILIGNVNNRKKYC